MKNLVILTLCLFFLSVSCNNDAEEMEKTISKIRIQQNASFVDQDGNLFFPWGLNYTNPKEVGLIEDQWEDAEVWNTINSDFEEMKTLGANVIRIHLQYHRFMEDATTPNLQALEKLFSLVQLAEDKGLYLDITGLAAYRASDQPSYYKNMTDSERWESHKVFWKAIAERVGDSPAIFAYNLMNEPVVSVGCETGVDCDWLPGQSLGGFNFVQNITRDPDKLFAPTIKEWIAEMTSAIRQVDAQTLITVGFLNIGSISQFAEDLDYISVHIYPESGLVNDAIDYVSDNQSSVPLVVEETSNFNCNIDELGVFVDGIENNYQGLMGHYFGQTIDELDDTIIVDALHKNFLMFFIERKPQ